MKKTIWFDMDGTIANLYGVENWLSKLIAHDASPYAEAAVMLNMSQLARLLNKVQAVGYSIGIISWLSKSPTPEYDEAVTEAKKSWLSQHLKSVHFDEINIVSHGTPKEDFMNTPYDILFDDEEQNRKNWLGYSYEPDEIVTVLKELLQNDDDDSPRYCFVDGDDENAILYF